MTKYTEEFRRKIIQHYLSTQDGVKRTAKIFGVHKATIQDWVSKHKEHGEDVAVADKKRRKYSFSVKESIILGILDNHMSIRQAAAKYNVSRLQISRWLERYKTGGIEALVGMKQKKRTDAGTQAKKPAFLTHEEELEYLRAENAYLKKLQALIQQNHCVQPQKKRK